jgi:hydrogenase/urease accessory protein HupE
MSLRAVKIGLGAALVILPSLAQAHLVNSGLGPIYDGILHLLLSPADVLGLMAATLLAGLHGARASRLTVIVLPVTWFLAGLAGLALPAMLELPWLSVLSFALLGVLVALNPKLPAEAVALLAGLFGALHGLLNGSALAAIGAGWTSLLGIALAVWVVALLVSAWVVTLQADWARIAVRVAGSWVAAVGILMFGWMLQ